MQSACLASSKYRGLKVPSVRRVVKIKADIQLFNAGRYFGASSRFCPAVTHSKWIPKCPKPQFTICPSLKRQMFQIALH